MIKDFLQAFKPTPLSLIFMLLGLLLQVAFCTSSSFAHALNGDELDQTTLAFGLGSPITLITVGGNTSYHIQWVILAINLAIIYALATLIATALAGIARLRRPAVAYGLVAVVMLVVTFLVSIGISKAYWGYFMSRPTLLSEVGEIATVKSIVPFKIEPEASAKRANALDNTYSLAQRLASGKKYGDESHEERILIELERRNLLPADFATTLYGLPELYPLVQSSGVLATSSKGYDSSARLEGIAVDATDMTGNRLMVLGMTGGQLSNDHYPYYELVFRAKETAAELSFLRGQRFFYDAAGMEGFEWYVIMLYLSVPGIAAGFVIFTVGRLIWRGKPDAV